MDRMRKDINLVDYIIIIIIILSSFLFNLNFLIWFGLKEMGYMEGEVVKVLYPFSLIQRKC